MRLAPALVKLPEQGRLNIELLKKIVVLREELNASLIF